MWSQRQSYYIKAFKCCLLYQFLLSYTLELQGKFIPWKKIVLLSAFFTKYGCLYVCFFFKGLFLSRFLYQRSCCSCRVHISLGFTSHLADNRDKRKHVINNILKVLIFLHIMCYGVYTAISKLL